MVVVYKVGSPPLHLSTRIKHTSVSSLPLQQDVHSTGPPHLNTTQSKPAMPSFAPDRDIPSLAGKVLLITGGTAGLGLGSITELSKHSPAHIFFTGRNRKSADSLIAKLSTSAPDVRITFIPCDISSLNSVREAAAAFTAQTQRLDILMLNAGIMAVDPSLSVDHYEIQFATNYLGHTLLVRRLLPLLERTAEQHGDARIVNLTSTAYGQAPSNGVDFATLKTSQASLGGMLPVPGGKWSRYGQSKVAQMLYSQELAKRHPTLTSVSVHPGVIQTALFDHVDFFTKLPTMFFKKTPLEQGHWQQCWAATCPKSGLKNGEYYEPGGVVGVRTTRASKDVQLAAKLWEWTEKELDAFERK
ncbi:hypothetical protein LTR91_016030 [Friedmanniomyces endolithicus]|uniref:Oxidoreductase n=1 Tax=Friedmanniomyces endolithicus TaxID=329885 RepID=A0AAN6K8R1_9PEZI|nr:hypothetical protein LTR94_000467 [Friedmanniomyces endolithicus]KAK0802682.1 hypothetical protein LTR38_006378 [Friedmanniomyces endolithicus]KAK0806853.1 hypothetical protein LTR59_003529 [Friedmanniomyces endolithicus]KAK0808572.1 hypothetical protein LTR75_006279 [Friedmanniomyces endolithicus]KAK0842227.1 hypothetical protein LTS02_016554 [Friedmanniomyces endolithicus]